MNLDFDIRFRSFEVANQRNNIKYADVVVDNRQKDDVKSSETK